MASQMVSDELKLYPFASSDKCEHNPKSRCLTTDAQFQEYKSDYKSDQVVLACDY